MPGSSWWPRSVFLRTPIGADRASPAYPRVAGRAWNRPEIPTSDDSDACPSPKRDGACRPHFGHTKSYARRTAGRTIPPLCPRAGRGRVQVAGRPGLSRAAARTRREQLLRGVPGSRVYGQGSGLRRLRTGVRVHCQRAGLLRPARLHRSKAVRVVSQRPQGRSTRGGRGSQRRLRVRWRVGQGPSADVPGHVQPVWQGDRGSVPADQRQAGLLQRLLPSRPRQLTQTRRRRPGPRARVV